MGHVGERVEERVPVTDGASPCTDTELSPALRAARRVALVLEEGDRDGRLAVLARVAAIRQSLGWYGVCALGRDVIDQYALAVVHAEVLRACVGALKAVPLDETGRDETGRQAEPVWEAFGQLTGVVGLSPTAEGDDDPTTLCRAWERRLERAERGLRGAARLVRHARKAGWLPPESGLPARTSAGDVCPAGSTGIGGGSSSGDPLAPLAAPLSPPILPPLRGEAAEVAAETRARIDAMKEAWPPPSRISREALNAPDCPWNPFDYEVECDLEGRPIEGGAWLVLHCEPEHPDDLLADLASWAPEYTDAEYAAPRDDGSL